MNVADTVNHAFGGFFHPVAQWERLGAPLYSTARKAANGMESQFAGDCERDPINALKIDSNWSNGGRGC